jgi:hypothetical protein
MSNVFKFEFIRMERDAAFMTHFKGGGGATYKSFGTSDI